MSIKDYFNKKIAVYRLSDSGDATRPYAISFGNTGTIEAHIQRIEDGDTLDTYGVQGALWKAWVDVDTDIKEGDEIMDRGDNRYTVIAVNKLELSFHINNHLELILKEYGPRSSN